MLLRPRPRPRAGYNREPKGPSLAWKRGRAPTSLSGCRVAHLKSDDERNACRISISSNFNNTYRPHTIDQPYVLLMLVASWERFGSGHARRQREQVLRELKAAD